MTHDHEGEPKAGFAAEIPDRMADIEYATLLHRAEQGGLYPADFARCDELLPHVSPELRGPFGRPQ